MNYREFNEKELPELVGKVVRHKSRPKTACLIIKCNYYPALDSYELGVGDVVGYTPKDLLEYFKFLDGTPCGVKEEKTYTVMELDVNKKYQIKGLDSIICYQPQSNRWVYNESEAGVKLNSDILNAKFIEL